MGIRGAKTIEEFKKMQKIEQWVSRNFVEGSVEWHLAADDKIEFTDRKGDKMILEYKDIH